MTPPDKSDSEIVEQAELSGNALDISGSGGIKRFAKHAVGYLLAIGCLIWVFHDIKIEQALREMQNVKWGWVAAGIAFDFLSYLCQGMRWRLLLKPVGDVSLVRTTQAIYSGLFTNEILPFRTGELVRTYLVSRWTSIKFMSIIPSILVERFFDSIWIGIGIALTAMFANLPRDLLDAADAFGIIVLVFIGIFIFLVLRRGKELPPGIEKRPMKIWGLAAISRFLTRLAAGVKAIGASRYFYLAFLASSLILGSQILAFWCVMLGYGLGLSLWTGAAVMMIVILGVAIPNAPSNVGTYQFFSVIGLTIFGVDKTTAGGFSLVVFIILTVPLWLIGYLAISRSGMRLRDIRSEISKIIKRQNEATGV
jgi:hypothetical protein